LLDVDGVNMHILVDSVNICLRERGVSSNSASRARYHHGDARNALLQAAMDLLETAGAAGLSLRQLAERAGLSRQAPYNHFTDKEALLAELVREGFERLGRMTRSCGDDTQSPLAWLGKAAEGYIEFAQTHRHSFV